MVIQADIYLMSREGARYGEYEYQHEHQQLWAASQEELKLERRDAR
jgi:hypothetical protein